jgi:hypothetical protein
VSGYIRARKTTAKTQRGGGTRRVIARGVTNLGNGKARGVTAKPAVLPGQAPVIPDQAASPALEDVPSRRGYLAREHLRRDIGSRVLVLDLAAPDAPPAAPGGFRDPDGAMLRYAADCVTHRERKYFGGYATASRAAKASHQWCAGCKTELARHHRLQSKASAQASARR